MLSGVKLLILGAAIAAAALVLLALEALGLSRIRRSIPIRVCVTGTRGKSSVVRLLAAALREAGLPVVAKTTGSLPCLLLPDGTERVLRRVGPPSILEQKRLLRKAGRLKARALVAEIMSISPETQFVESRRILGADLCLITNVRSDHLETLGASREEAERALALSIPPGGTVLCLDSECLPDVEQAADRLGARLVRVPAELNPSLKRSLSALPYREFEENVSLALGAAMHLEVPPETALRGMRGVRADAGALRAWSIPTAAGPLVAVNAFAANDPESTRRVIASLGLQPTGRAGRRLEAGAGSAYLVAPAAAPVLAPGPIVGLLNLRRDRGDRSLQWVEAIRSGSFEIFEVFDRLLLMGPHAHAVRRKLASTSGKVSICGGLRPELTAMRRLVAGGGTVIGFGNIAGPGMRLVHLWERVGTAHEL